MKIHPVDPSATAMIQKIIAIHDEMPRAWNPGHHVAPEYLQKLIMEIHDSKEPQGFWILSHSEAPSPNDIDGMLWAKIKKAMGVELVCSINSFWIRPELRNQDLAPLLTLTCLQWAREHQAVRLECSTHAANTRMRAILEKHHFKPGMIQYTLDLPAH